MYMGAVFLLQNVTYLIPLDTLYEISWLLKVIYLYATFIRLYVWKKLPKFLM